MSIITNKEVRYRAASLALGVTVLLTLLKLGTAYLSDSVGVLSEGLHSFLDLVSTAVSFFTVREAGKPADQEHPFGHGKFETLSSLFESILLACAAGLIVYEGVVHLSHPRPIHYPWLAIGVILFSFAVSYWTYRHNSFAALQTESSAIHLNALHFFSDMISSLGILIGLIFMKLTGWTMIDPLIAFVVAAYILVISARQVKGALAELSDTQLPEHEIRQIRELLDSHQGKMINAHELRTRKSGSTRHIDFHLVVCGELTVKASHALCDEFEASILEVFPQASVNIHVEPCTQEDSQCHVHCRIPRTIS